MKLTTVCLVVMLCGLSVLCGAQVQGYSIDLSKLREKAELVTYIWDALDLLPVIPLKVQITQNRLKQMNIKCTNPSSKQGGEGRRLEQGGHPSYRVAPKQTVVTWNSGSITMKIASFFGTPNIQETYEHDGWKISGLFSDMNFKFEAEGQLTNNVDGSNAQGRVGPGAQQLSGMPTNPTPVHADYDLHRQVYVTVYIREDTTNGQVTVYVESLDYGEDPCKDNDESSFQSPIVGPKCTFLCDQGTKGQFAALIRDESQLMMTEIGNALQRFLRNYEKGKTTTAAPI